MTPESQFLAAIESDPENDDLKLVYADWLDEQSDPRGQLIRLSVEMRRLAIGADAAWLRRLKIQRERFDLKRLAKRAVDMDGLNNPVASVVILAHGERLEFEGEVIQYRTGDLQRGLLQVVELSIAIPSDEQSSVSVGADGRCRCSCADRCPLGRSGMDYRCTADELIAAGIVIP